MREETLTVRTAAGDAVSLPMTWVHTLVIGSGASGLNGAVQLRAAGVEDVLIVTEGLHMGTSINTGSDKQTYYKLSMCGDDADSPRAMAGSYFSGGSMHGDLALVEATLSARAFIHLVPGTNTASSSATRPTTIPGSGRHPSVRTRRGRCAAR
jgi:succinate dehydrogenase/fumarate reductase flavoprotein subunit